MSIDETLYSLHPAPPLAATLTAHACTITATWFGVSRRTLEVWPIAFPIVNHKRQPLTEEVWAVAAAHYTTDAELDIALARLPADFAEAVRVRVPAAREALAEARRSRSRKVAA